MIYIQLIFNLMLIIGLFVGSIASIALWRTSKKLTKKLQQNIPKYYSQEFLNLINPNKYTNLNNDIKNLIIKSEQQPKQKTIDEIKQVKQKFYLKEEFIEFLIGEIEIYKEKIQIWQKIGNISVVLSIIGAIFSVVFMVI